MNLEGLIKLLPFIPIPDYVKDEVIPRAQALLRDEKVNANLLMVLDEVYPAVLAASKNPKTDKKLREAFNDVAAVFPPVRKLVAKKGEISVWDVKGYVGLARNIWPKKDRLEQVFTEALQSGDPAITELALTLVANQRLIGAVDKLLPNVLPQERQHLLQDQAIRNDLAVIVAELQRTVNEASKDPAIEEKLKEAFLNVDTSMSAFSIYLKNLSLLDIPQSLMVEFIVNRTKYEESGLVLAEAFKAEDPAVMNLAQSMRGNADAVAALKRIVPKTHGKLFRLEQDAAGQGYAVELVSGKQMKIALEKADYDEIRSALPATQAQPPRPGQGPKGPGLS